MAVKSTNKLDVVKKKRKGIHAKSKTSTVGTLDQNIVEMFTPHRPS